MMKNKPIIITPGEPAGIGPDIVIQIAQKKILYPIVVCCSAKLLIDRAKQINLPLKLIEYNANNIKLQKKGQINILPIETIKPVTPGVLCKENSFYVLQTLTRACNGCMNKEFSALITGPINKGIINDYGIKFTGHTEFLLEKSYCKNVVMMMISKTMKVALVTTHIPLKNVSLEITKKKLYDTIIILNNSLINKFGINNPHILVCGLNPHAGENNYIGLEENEIIIPVLQHLKKKRINLTGPLSADTLFQKKYLNQADAILAMYHDQGLPVLKYHSFGKAVNITLGLPFIRTSVDHGTALEISGKKSDFGSLKEAIKLTIKMINFNK